MLAAVYKAPQTIVAEDRPTPEPGPGEVRVRVRACGVCGTDLHLFHGNHYAVGHTPGHEMAGVVEALGPEVRDVAVGDPVAVEPMKTCGVCDYCRTGRHSICPDLQLYGIGLPGGFAESLVVPALRCFPVPADLPWAVAALAEPMAVVVHGMRRGRLEKGQRVLVLGAGSVGLAAILAARSLGAGEVIATARYARQAELALALGAARVLMEEEASPKALAKFGRGSPIDLAVETVGGEADTLRAASAAIRPGGAVSVLGVFMSKLTLDPFPLLNKEGTLAWSNCYHHHARDRADFADAIRILDARRAEAARLVTHEVPLAEIGRAYEIAGNKKAGAVKVAVLTV